MKTLGLINGGLFALTMIVALAVAMSPTAMTDKIWIIVGCFGIMFAYIAVAEISIQAKTGTLREFWQKFGTKTFWIKAIGISFGSAVLMYLLAQKDGWLLPCVFGVGIGVIAPIHGSLSGSFFCRISSAK